MGHSRPLARTDEVEKVVFAVHRIARAVEGAGVFTEESFALGDGEESAATVVDGRFIQPTNITTIDGGLVLECDRANFELHLGHHFVIKDKGVGFVGDGDLVRVTVFDHNIVFRIVVDAEEMDTGAHLVSAGSSFH